MDDRFNTVAGWTLFSGIVALGLTTLSARYYEADKNPRPEKMGHPIEGVVSSEGGEKAVPLPTLLAAADPAKGEQVFKKCASCHTIAQGAANGIGPNLHGVLGEPIGAGAGGFAFSDALKSVGGNWDFEKLDHWLASPKKMAPGTKMTFAGLESATDRANVIVYLNAQGSNVPLPKAEAAPAAEASGAAAPAGGAPVAAAGGAPAPGAAQAPLPVGAASPKVGDNKAVGNVHETQAH
ncbi:MAG: cytochrome c family protein [Novosphingobium sp.]